MKQLALALGSILALTPAALSQGAVWVVDDDGSPGSDFTDLQAAIDAAADGDVVLIQEGQYGDCTLDDRALTVIADVGEQVNVGDLTIENTAFGKTVRVHGLTSVDVTLDATCEVRNNAGFVWIEGCEFEPADSGPLAGESPGISIVASSAVVLVDVTARGQFLPGGTVDPLPTIPIGDPGPGGAIRDSNVLLFGCEFVGGDGAHFADWQYAEFSWSTHGANGLDVTGSSTVHMSTTGATGGKGGGAYSLGVTGCGAAGDGGLGLSIACDGACPTVAQQAGAFVGGAGGDAWILFTTCPGGADGAPSDVAPGAALQDVLLPPMGMTTTSPVRENTVLDVALQGPPSSLAMLGVSFEPAALYSPWWGAPLALAPPYLFVALGTTTTAGELSLGLPMPQLPPGVESMVFYGQCGFVDAFGVGGIGQARALVLIDDAF